jgi:hypothetical protein
MDLRHAYELLAAAEKQPNGFIKVHDRRADHEVRLMAEAGLVEATLNDGAKGSFTSINGITVLGRSFLRAFKDHFVASRAALPPSQSC